MGDPAGALEAVDDQRGQLVDLDSVHEALADARLQVAPLSGPGGDPVEVTGYRLLVNPLAFATAPRRRPVSGWLIAGAVFLASAAILCALTAALLL